MSPDQLIRRGQGAGALLEDPLVREVFATAESDIVGEWLDADNPVDREAAWYAVRALQRIQHLLRTIRDDGLVASEAVRRGR